MMRSESEVRDFLAFMKQIGIDWQSPANLTPDPATVTFANDCATVALCWVVGEVELPPGVAEEFKQFKESTESN